MKKICTALLCLILTICLIPSNAFAVEREETPDYKVAFYAFDCYHMQDENGKRSGYGYDMMQGISKYLQCTFSYVGYDKTASECEEALRNGEIDIYTAAKKTPEREKEFAFSTHPAITSFTCMNVKVGNNKIVAGDYSTYNGLRIGLLKRHTYNNAFLEYVQEKGIDCDIVYYETPTELSNALVNDEVDALVNSYIRIPEDEKTIENFGETPYYIMARKEDQPLINQLDYAIDCMNVETPNWRTELYIQYYGSVENNLELTENEQAFLSELQDSGKPVTAVMNPDAKPYSWYEKGEAQGIIADIFRATAEKLNLNYEIIPVSTKEEYEELVASGSVDIWMDMIVNNDNEISSKYKSTGSYLSTTVSVLRNRGASKKVMNLAVDDDHIAMREIISNVWEEAELTVLNSTDECVKQVLSGNSDAALLMSYTAQHLARDDMQNRLSVDIVPGASLSLCMGVNAADNIAFYGLWEKTLVGVADQVSAEIVQKYLEQNTTPTFVEYLFDHPIYFIIISCGAALLLLMICLYVQSARSKKKQEKISGELAVALKKAEEATTAKQNFFSKMSHDIRTPLNVVLGMTQIAQKYKGDPEKLENALNNVTKEGNYLLMLINSILDVNQLEHGVVELIKEPFNPADCLKESADMLRTLAEKKDQQFTLKCDCNDRVVIGDKNRLKQILINIASNAIKYTNNGGHISLELESLPENRYRFTCTDDGIGMSAEFVQHICEDYARAEDSRVSKTQGTGLGMSVVKGFTDLMGGTLTIKSELGKGSTFIVEIPFPPASEEERQAVLHPAAEDNSKLTEFVGKKVLLVEDNALNAEIAIELLNTIGLQVDWAENGELGLQKFEESGHDEYFAIFMDMQMPVMDGVTATKRIRQSSRPDHDIPIFAMTANTFANDRRSCHDAGMNGYIPKPVNVKDIESALNVIEDI